jgi:hypothetical protein
LWNDNQNKTQFDVKIFDENFKFKILDYLQNKKSKNLLESFFLRFCRLVELLIVKLLVNRFKNTQLIFDEVECIDNDICEILEMVCDLFSSVKASLDKCTSDESKIKKMDCLFDQLQELFGDCSGNVYLDLIKYIKFREMREYLERKKKSKFVRYRRNDEKIKKIYKNVMLNIYTNFKENELETNSNFSQNYFNLNLENKSKRNEEEDFSIKLGKKSRDFPNLNRENKVITHQLK